MLNEGQREREKRDDGRKRTGTTYVGTAGAVLELEPGAEIVEEVGLDGVPVEREGDEGTFLLVAIFEVGVCIGLVLGRGGVEEGRLADMID